MLTEYVATAFGKKGVRCNAVAPSMISTPLLRSFIPEELVKLNEDATLTPFLGEPEDIAAFVAFLASDDARYLNGQVCRADGGTTAPQQPYPDARRFYGADCTQPTAKERTMPQTVDEVWNNGGLPDEGFT